MLQTQFLDLNDDCLEHILNRMDMHSILTTSKTCKRLYRIAENVYKMQREFTCEMFAYDEKKKKEKTKEAQVIIRKIGKHLVKFVLDLEYPKPKYPVQNQRDKGYNDNSSEFLTSIQDSFSNKLRELTIRSRLLTIPTLKLSTTFESLTKLVLYKYVQDIREWYGTLDLMALCPNLQVLIIQNCPWMLAEPPIKKFKNLLELEFRSLGTYYPTEWFEWFFEANKQLRKLSIGQLWGRYEYTEFLMYDYLFDFKKVVIHLKDLEQLDIDIKPFTNVNQGLIALSQLNNLHTLKMKHKDGLSMADLNEMLRILRNCTHLIHLHIDIELKDSKLPDQQSVVNIAIELKSLQTFHSNLRWKWETLYEFVRRARGLMEIEVNLTKYANYTPNAIRQIAAARKSALVNEHQPLTIYFGYFESRRLVEDVIQVAYI